MLLGDLHQCYYVIGLDVNMNIERLIVHSDQGVQYASKAYRRLIKTHSFIGSISKKGCCWDNAVAESFFGSLKQERVHWRNYSTRSCAQQYILNYITMW